MKNEALAGKRFFWNRKSDFPLNTDTIGEKKESVLHTYEENLPRD